MIWKRITYAAVLLAAIAAFIITDNGIALFVCICLLALPLISLLMLFFAAKRVRFACEMRESCIRGSALQIIMKAGLSPRFLAGIVSITAEIENSTFHKTERRNFLFKDLSFTPHVYEYVSSDSGRICVRIHTIKLIDLFGICSVNVKCSYVAESSVSPMLYDDIRVRVGESKYGSPYGEVSLPKKGGDITEIFNIRDYVPGDAINAVHWKLSSKFDSVKSKEFGCTDDNRLLILVDMSRCKYDNVASDIQLNAVLDAAVSISGALKSSGYTHCVGWFEDGIFSSCEVSEGNSFLEMVYKLMSIKVNEGNAESLFYLSRTALDATFTKLVVITTAIQTEELKEYGNIDVTAIIVSDLFGETEQGNIKIIDMPCGRIHETLEALII